MQRWGKTASGKQRFRCPECKRSSIHSRRDNITRSNCRWFVDWLTGSNRLENVAGSAGITVQGLLKRFKPFWQHSPQPCMPSSSPRVLVVDGITIVKRAAVALIACDPHKRQPVSWQFVPRESYGYWQHLFLSLKAQGVMPVYTVCDGQRGLLKALVAVWPEVKVQRCIIHVIRQAKAWLTQKPQTQAGKELLALVRVLPHVHTRRQKRRWLRAYRHWLKRHEAFLKERSYHGKCWWYTHRKLRAVRSLLTNSLPHLFTHIGHPEVPRTSNHVEGGINSRIKDLLRVHRGLLPRHQQVMVAWYLAVRQGQKPTRQFN